MPPDAQQQRQRPDLMAPSLCHLAPALARIGDAGEESPMVDTPDGELPAWTDWVASTSEEDRNDNIFKQNWNLKAYNDNPLILWMHNRHKPPLGTGKPRIIHANTDAAYLCIRVFWDLADPEARKIAGKVHRGVLRAGSVGAYPGTGTVYRSELPETDPDYKDSWWGRVINRPVLFEFSVVTIQANPSSLKNADDPNSPPALPAPTRPAPPDPTTPGQSMDLRLLLCTVLALSVESTDAEIQAAADAHPDTLTRATAAEAAIRQALQLADDAPLPADVGAQLVIATSKAGYISLAEANQLVIAASQGATTDPTVAALAAIDEAVNTGKIAPAMKAHFVAMAQATPEAVTAALAGLKAGATVPTQPQPKPPVKTTASTGPLSAEVLAVLKQTGMTVAEYRAELAKTGGALNPSPEA